MSLLSNCTTRITTAATQIQMVSMKEKNENEGK
jgi:hypothetical protein